jgi:GPH family glycoside/pentoside/hexuronide:cation symporter
MMSVAVSAVLLVAGFSCFALTRTARQTSAAVSSRRPGLGMLRQLSAVRSNRPFVLVILSKLALLLAIASFGATFTYYVVHVLHASYTLLGTFTLASTATMFASLPLWMRLVRRVDKRRAYFVAALAYACLSLTWLLAEPGENVLWVLARGAAMGALGCGTLLAGQALLPDAIEYDWLAHGERREALFAGFYTMVEKLASALGLAITGAMLGALGYVSSKGGVQVVQPESALVGVTIGVSVLPAVMLVTSCLLLVRYDLGPERLAALRRQRGAELPRGV